MKPETPPEKGNEQDNKIEVVVVTTAGSYPEQGTAAVPVRQKIRVVLARAANELKIRDTAGWVATVPGRSGRLDPEKTFLEEGLAGSVSIHYGPTAHGGGR